ncbi:hypothetical protein IEQ34_015180 [Dendrobium chrysotoxum]|uniref:Uncharacterized protein n=1 Tax=Dendrobium chrysotoxum TaxID=161865 RepID=A0AAV7GNI5_DENCH|nr:hypothetical protein IEQ34_015180 [Dendrobium chrysotoxum]
MIPLLRSSHTLCFVAVRLRSFDNVLFLFQRKLCHFWIVSNNESALAVKLLRPIPVSFGAVRLRSFDNIPFLFDRKLRHFLIGSHNGISLAVKLINNNASRVVGLAFYLLYLVDSVRLRCFAPVTRVACSAPSWLLFDFTPSTTFPSCQIGIYDILIGSNDGSSLDVKADMWMDGASESATDQSVPEFVGRIGRVGLGIKIMPIDRAASSADPVAKKLQGKLNAVKKKSAKNYEKENPAEENGLGDSEDDDEPESRIKALAKKRPHPAAPPQQYTKKIR